LSLPEYIFTTIIPLFGGCCEKCRIQISILTIKVQLHELWPRKPVCFFLNFPSELKELPILILEGCYKFDLTSWLKHISFVKNSLRLLWGQILREANICSNNLTLSSNKKIVFICLHFSLSFPLGHVWAKNSNKMYVCLTTSSWMGDKLEEPQSSTINLSG